ncbi:MAG: hypothetical protein JWP80_4883 [Pseudomonas sp.]|nr:hypothetical protein [Pseudomonas sp.]
MSAKAIQRGAPERPRRMVFADKSAPTQSACERRDAKSLITIGHFSLDLCDLAIKLLDFLLLGSG